MLVIGTALGIASLRGSDPPIVVTMLLLSEVAFIWLFLVHAGNRLWRVVGAVIVTVILGAVGIRSYTDSSSQGAMALEKNVLIEPSYDLQMFGLPIVIPASSTMYIIRLQQGRKIEPINIVNQTLAPMQWPGKEKLYPPESVGKISLSNHGAVSVFNVLYQFAMDVGGTNEPGGVTTVQISLPLFDIPVGQSRGFYIVNQSQDVGILRLSPQALLQVQGSTTRTRIQLHPRDITFFDKLPMLSQSIHTWSGDKILPPFDTASRYRAK